MTQPQPVIAEPAQMPTWLKVLIGIAGFIAFVLAIVAFVFQLTSGLVESADNFFTAVKQKDMTTARTYLAEDFKKSTDENALNQFLSNSALINFKQANWANREINNGRGTLEGEITTETGGVVPIKIAFVKENEEWKIYTIEKKAAGIQTSDEKTDSPKAITSNDIPDNATQIAMVKQAMHDFLVSVKAKDMTHFRTTLSQLWQEQYSVEQLNQAYKPITDNNANWSVIENFTPTVSAEKNEEGILILTGSYSTKPSRVDFEQGYMYENGAWKLLSFSIEAKADNTQ